MPPVNVTVPGRLPNWPRKCACCLRDPTVALRLVQHDEPPPPPVKPARRKPPA